jgi:hypothetical protein
LQVKPLVGDLKYKVRTDLNCTPGTNCEYLDRLVAQIDIWFAVMTSGVFVNVSSSQVVPAYEQRKMEIEQPPSWFFFVAMIVEGALSLLWVWVQALFVASPSSAYRPLRVTDASSFFPPRWRDRPTPPPSSHRDCVFVKHLHIRRILECNENFKVIQTWFNWNNLL